MRLFSIWGIGLRGTSRRDVLLPLRGFLMRVQPCGGGAKGLEFAASVKTA